MKKDLPIKWVLPPQVRIGKSIYPPENTTKNQIYSALVSLQQQLKTK